MNYFITNREILLSDGKEFIREDGIENAGDNLRFGTYNSSSKQFELFPEPDEDSDLLYSQINRQDENSLKGSSKFFKDIYSVSSENDLSDVLFFIHGFNTDLDGVRENFELLNKTYVQNTDSPIKHIVIFTWPGKSLGLPFHYHDDKKDAIRSGEALARGFEKLLNFFQNFLVKDRNPSCGSNINLMLHSMGTRVFKHAMLELKRKGIKYPEFFKEIFLMASDVNYDVFDRENAFYNLIDFGQRVHIFYHQRDKVLDISKYSKNFNNRLGRYGRKSVDNNLRYVLDYDVSDVNDDLVKHFREDALNHWYYYSSSEVVKKVIDLVRQ